jgi:hypothetical protein
MLLLITLALVVALKAFPQVQHHLGQKTCVLRTGKIAGQGKDVVAVAHI